MIRRLGLLLMAACDELRRTESGSGPKHAAKKNGVPLHLFVANGGSLVDHQVGRTVGSR